LETKLETIITKLEALGELKREEHIKNEEWHRQWQEQQRIEREKQEKKAKELSDFKSIFHRAIRLHQSNIMRNYISKVEETSVIKEQVTDELRDWLLWAKKKIDWYDPLKNSEDETFDEDDKGKIFSDLLKEWL
jgi:pantothenate kinase-related protein Tda10